MSSELGTDWTSVLLEGTAAVIAGLTVLVSVVIGARIYREGVHDRRPDPRDDEELEDK